MSKATLEITDAWGERNQKSSRECEVGDQSLKCRHLPVRCMNAHPASAAGKQITIKAWGLIEKNERSAEE
jgi:hypothetical protein